MCKVLNKNIMACENKQLKNDVNFEEQEKAHQDHRHDLEVSPSEANLQSREPGGPGHQPEQEVHDFSLE